MFEFNEDGSLKLPDRVVKEKQEKEHRMEKAKCLLIRKEQVSCSPPKKCVLHLKLSEAIDNNKFVETIYKTFNEDAETPFKITKINDKEFDIEIGTSFRRCSECISFINRFRGFMYGNVIEEKGSCTYDDLIRTQDFCDEDYFD